MSIRTMVSVAGLATVAFAVSVSLAAPIARDDGTIEIAVNMGGTNQIGASKLELRYPWLRYELVDVVKPDGSNRTCANLFTRSRNGTPYCNATETVVANESMRPETVEPSFAILRKISPG